MSLDARARRAAQAARNSIDRRPPPPAIGVLVARRRRRAAAANVLAVALIVAVGGVAWRFLPTGSPQPTATGLPRHVQAAIRVGKAPGAVAVEGSSVWVANSGDGTVSRIDPATNKVIATIGVGGRPTHLTAQSGALWVTTPHSLQLIDPATNKVVQTLPLAAGPGDAALVFEGCWRCRSTMARYGSSPHSMVGKSGLSRWPPGACQRWPMTGASCGRPMATRWSLSTIWSSRQQPGSHSSGIRTGARR